MKAIWSPMHFRGPAPNGLKSSSVPGTVIDGKATRIEDVVSPVVRPSELDSLCPRARARRPPYFPSYVVGDKVELPRRSQVINANILAYALSHPPGGEEMRGRAYHGRRLSDAERSKEGGVSPHQAP